MFTLLQNTFIIACLPDYLAKMRAMLNLRTSGSAGARKQWDSIKLCKNADGSPSLLGQGRYGMVRLQSQAIRKLSLAQPAVACCCTSGCTDYSIAAEPEQDTVDAWVRVTSQVYKGVLNKTTVVAVKTFSHQGTDLEVIRFNAVSYQPPHCKRPQSSSRLLLAGKYG